MPSRFKTVSQYVSSDDAAQLVGISNSDRFWPSLGFDGCIWINDTCPGKWDSKTKSSGILWPKEQVKVRVSRLKTGYVKVTGYERFAVTRYVQIKYLADSDAGGKVLNLLQLKRLLRKVLGNGVKLATTIGGLPKILTEAYRPTKVVTRYHGIVELPVGYSYSKEVV